MQEDRREGSGGISVKGLKKSFWTGGVCTEVLCGLEFEMEPGAFCAIMGSSGCGKSTLMNLLCGLERPDEGSCIVNGKELGKMSPRELALYRNREIGIIFQGFYLDETRSLTDNVAMPLGYRGVPARERRQAAEDILKEFGLFDERKKRPSQVSGGQQQRAAIARAIVNHPRLLLADEPTGNLDEANTRQVMKLFTKLHEMGTGILLVTHDAEVAAYARRRFVIEHGVMNEV